MKSMRIGGIAIIGSMLGFVSAKEFATPVSYDYVVQVTSNFGGIYGDAVGAMETGTITYLPTSGHADTGLHYMSYSNNLLAFTFEGRTIPQSGGANADVYGDTILLVHLILLAIFISLPKVFRGHFFKKLI
jgi:hypothetical protein